MKGLFMKDLGLLKGQKQFFGIILIMMMIFMTAYTNFAFIMAYITIMIGVLTLNTISYDEFENGMGYLFTLPVSRKEYVAEKYLFSIVTTLPGLAAVSVFSFVFSRIREIEFSVGEWALSVVISFLLVTVVLAVIIPLQLKFGADKSRVALMIVWGIGIMAVYLGIKVCEAFGINWEGAIEWIYGMKPAVSLAGITVICGILMAISYLISVQFIEKREF